MPKNFKKALGDLTALGKDIEKYQYNCDTVEKAKEAKRLITLYGKASELITPKNPKELSLLSGVKGYYDPIRDQVRSLANRTIATFNRQKLTQEQQMREHLEFIQQLKQEANHLFSRVQDAADLFLSVKTTVNMETLQKTYEARRRDFMAIIVKMPSDISHGYQAELSELNRQVNVHRNNLLKQKENKKAEFRATITKASEYVDGLTLVEIVKSLAPKASLHEVNGILNGKRVTAILGQESDHGALVLANFPKPTQVQLIAAFISELGLVQSPQRELAATETTALTQFAQAVVKNAQELQEGKKQLLSLLSVEKGRVSVMHVNLQHVLENPIDMITEIAMQLYMQGSRGNITMQLTSYREAAQLQELAGIQYLRLIGNERLAPSNHSLEDISSLVLVSNPRQLTQITGNSSSTEALLKVEHELRNLHSATQSKGYTLSQMMDILRVLAIITTSYQMMMSNNHRQEAQLLSAREQAHLPLGSRSLTAQGNNPQVLLEQVTRERAARLTNLVAKHKSSFDQYLKELKEKTDDLADKGNVANPKYNPRYQKVGSEATLLFNNLEAAGKRFFDANNPATPQSYQQFVNECFDSIAMASEHFIQHRGLWNNIPEVLRCLMGLILAIPIGIPALLTGYGSNYSNAFFRTPPTDAFVKLETYQDKLSSLLGDIERDRPELLPQAISM